MPHHLYVFGSNGEGQLGIPAADIVDSPTLYSTVEPRQMLRSVHGGDNHTLLFSEGGDVYGVGDNRKAQLMSRTERSSRQDTVKFLRSGVSFIATACESSAYVTTHDAPAQSTVHTQGQGLWGELGYGEDITSVVEDSDVPSAPGITLPGSVKDFAAGVWHYVAVLDDGSVYGWGKGRVGQLGAQFSGKVAQPTKIENIPFKPQRVICGKEFTYLVGPPFTGEHIVLGKDKNKIISSMPGHVAGWKDIGATWHAIFVLFDDGKLIAWGRNTIWELIPPGLPLIDKIAVGSEHVLAVTQDGRLISWGWGKHGNCGNLAKLQDKIKMDMVSGLWNEIELPGKVEFIGAGSCTSFVGISA
jgi:protein ATS1